MGSRASSPENIRCLADNEKNLSLSDILTLGKKKARSAAENFRDFPNSPKIESDDASSALYRAYTTDVARHLRPKIFGISVKANGITSIRNSLSKTCARNISGWRKSDDNVIDSLIS